MKLWRLFVVAVAAAVAVTLIIKPDMPVEANVPTGQVARLRDQAPVSGTFGARYKNYGESYCCHGFYYTVAKGDIRTKVNSYVIKEEMKAYDFYLLDVDAALADQTGRSSWGDASFAVHTIAPAGTIIGTDDSRSVTRDPRDCQSFPVSVGAGIGWSAGGAGANVGASIDVGAVRFCDAAASFTVAHHGSDAIYHASRLAKIQRLNLARVVKVKAGTKPRFQVILTYPTDSCTAGGSRPETCGRFIDSTTSVVYRVGTTG